MGRLRHPIFARFYARFCEAADRMGVAEHRRELLDGVAGRVVEIGAGNGRNLLYYPEAVSEVVAVEPEPYMRARAGEAALAATFPVTLVDAPAEDLPFGGGSFDVAVFSLSLCSVQSQARALTEALRVLRPGGELRFYEHVRSERSRAAFGQDLVDVIWPLFAGGCHTNRDTPAAIARAGFALEHVRRFEFRPTPFSSPIAPHVIGRARRPA